MTNEESQIEVASGEIEKQYAAIETAEMNEELQDSLSLEELAMRTPLEDQLGRNPFVHRARWKSAADNIIYLMLWIVVFAAILYLLFF